MLCYKIYKHLLYPTRVYEKNRKNTEIMEILVLQETDAGGGRETGSNAFLVYDLPSLNKNAFPRIFHILADLRPTKMIKVAHAREENCANKTAPLLGRAPSAFDSYLPAFMINTWPNNGYR